MGAVGRVLLLGRQAGDSNVAARARREAIRWIVENLSLKASLDTVSERIEADRVQVDFAPAVVSEGDAGRPVVEDDSIAKLLKSLEQLRLVFDAVRQVKVVVEAGLLAEQRIDPPPARNPHRHAPG